MRKNLGTSTFFARQPGPTIYDCDLQSGYWDILKRGRELLKSSR